jgi:hypothetical protein
MMEGMLRDKEDARLAEMQDGWKEMKTCQETTEAKPEKLKACHEKIEPDPWMMQSVGEHQEVPKEEAAVMLVRGLRKQRRDHNLAMRRR